MVISGPHYLLNINNFYVVFSHTETQWHSLQQIQSSVEFLKISIFYLVDDTKFFELATFAVYLLC